MQIVRISLLGFFKTFHKYLPYLCEFWAIYFISAIFWLFFVQKIALVKKIAQNSHMVNCRNEYLASAKFG